MTRKRSTPGVVKADNISTKLTLPMQRADEDHACNILLLQWILAEDVSGRGAPRIFIIPRVSAWVLEFQVCLEGVPHGEAAAAEVEIPMRWVFTSSKRKPQFLNPLLDLKSSSIGDSVHRPHDFGTFLFPEPPTEENALLDNLLLKSTSGQT